MTGRRVPNRQGVLPVKPPSFAPQVQGTQTGNGQAPCVLVVDDEFSTREACVEVLGREGYEVHVAADGAEGLAKARELKPQMVIVDLKMPGMNGMDFIDELHETHPEIVPTMVTGYATLPTAVEAMKHGAFDFVAKPFTPDELRLCVRRAANQHRLICKSIALEHENQRMRDNFAAMVSHQLRGPLAAVAEYLEVLGEEIHGPLNERQRKAVGRMQDRTNALLEIVKDWLRLSHLEATGLGELQETVDLSEAVTEAWESVGKTLDTVHVTFEVVVKREPKPVRGDAGAIKEVFVNLCSNAVQYMPAGGTLRVTLDSEAGQATASVADTGPGIPEEELPYVFEDFFRGKRPEIIKTMGTGLGLAIVKRIVEVHGGTVIARSAPGEGATFIVRLPEAR